MFNIGFGELLIVLMVAFVIVGPDDLPKVARWLGRQLRKLRTLVRELKVETGLDVLEKEVQGVSKDVKATMRELDVSAEVEDAVKEIKTEIESVSKDMHREANNIGADIRREVKTMDTEVRSVITADGKIAETAATDK